jgi:hypothetical protein
MTIFDNYTSLYFYSAVFQGNAALIAFAAVFIVFKLQLLSQSTHSNQSSIESFARDQYAMNSSHVPEEIRSKFVDVEGLFPEMDRLISDPKYGPSNLHVTKSLRRNSTFIALIAEHKLLLSKRDDLISDIRAPFLQLLSVIILSLLILPLSTYVHSLGIYVEACLMIVVIVLNIVALVTNTRLVLKALKN